MFTPGQAGKNLGIREQKKIGHLGSMESAIYAIIQPDLRKQQFGLFRSMRRCAAVAVTYFMAATTGGAGRKAEIRRERRRQSRSRVASVEQFANSRRTAGIYGAGDISL